MRVAGKALKVMMLVEVRGFVVDRIHDDELAARVFRCVDDLLECPHQEHSPEARSVGILIKRKLC